jgi:hypothetical protein
MGAALERRDAPANKASHYVLRCEAGIPQFALDLMEGVTGPTVVFGLYVQFFIPVGGSSTYGGRLSRSTSVVFFA